MIDWKEIKAQIDSAENIVITSHQSPDGDAVGSSLGLLHYLRKKGKSPEVILPDMAPSFIAWLPGFNDINYFDKQRASCEELISNADLIFVLDYNDLKRVGEMGGKIEGSNAKVIMIDHHLHPKDFADFMYSDTSIASTCELIYFSIEKMEEIEMLDLDIATCLYLGIVTDTGSFRFSSVGSHTHRIAAHFIDLGLKQSEIHERVFDVNPINRLKLLGFVLNNRLEVLDGIPVALVSLSKKDLVPFDVKKGYTEGIVNYALSICLLYTSDAADD